MPDIIQVVGAAALVSAAVAILGWFVSSALMRRRDLVARRETSELHHLQQQIEELYGPLNGLIQQSALVHHEVAMRHLPNTDGKVDYGRFNDEHWKVWRYLIEQQSIPRNRQMAALLYSKPHLYLWPEMPASYLAFLRHQATAESLHLAWKETGVNFPMREDAGWPSGFAEDVKSDLDKLRRAHDLYLKRSW